MVAQQVNNTLLEQDTSGVIPAVKLALEAINSDPYILPGYYLTYENELNSEVRVCVYNCIIINIHGMISTFTNSVISKRYSVYLVTNVTTTCIYIL